MRRLACSLLVFAAFCLGDFNPQHWRYRIPVNAAGSGAVSEFTVSPEVYAHSAEQLLDLRLLRNSSVETPFLLKTLVGNLALNEKAVRMFNKGWTSKSGVRAVLDLSGHDEHNRLRLATSLQNFKQTVIVETSDDGKSWSTVVSNGVIFDISRPEVHVSQLTVSYPSSTRRFVRLTIPGWKDPAALESAWVAEYQDNLSVRDQLTGLKPTGVQHQQEQTTDFVFDLGYTGLPVDHLNLQVDTSAFSRPIAISTSRDQNQWIGDGGAYIFRTKSEENVSVDINQSWQRYIKVTVFNGDSFPIAIRSADVSWLRRIVRFPSNQPGNYQLYIDSADARAANYDFAKVDDPKSKATVVKLGVAELNPDFKGVQAPYSERNPWLLNAILVIAVALMGFITYRFARRARSTVA